MTISEQRRECYWLLMQWRQRATKEMAVLPLGNVMRLNRMLGNLNVLDRTLKQIHAGIRAMAAGVGAV